MRIMKSGETDTKRYRRDRRKKAAIPLGLPSSEYWTWKLFRESYTPPSLSDKRASTDQWN